VRFDIKSTIRIPEEEVSEKIVKCLVVCYVYNDFQTPLEKLVTLTLISADLADLPKDQIQRINTAAKSAMANHLLDLLEKIPPELKSQLRQPLFLYPLKTRPQQLSLHMTSRTGA
jgi:hypothetical protein